MAFGIKDIAEPALLNESIPPSRYKSKIFAKINSKGASRYYLLNALSKILAGYLFTINGYIPIIISLCILIFVAILSLFFIEPVKNKRKQNFDYLEIIRDTKEGFSYIFKSERLKSLILASALISAFISICFTYSVSLLEDLHIPVVIITLISTIGNLISSIGSKKEDKINKKFNNKTLVTISLMLSSCCILWGVLGAIGSQNIICISIILVTSLIYDFCNGTYYTIIDRYLTNFTNKQIDIKIFSANKITNNCTNIIGSLFASFLLNKVTTAYAMIIMGTIFTLIYILLGKYMKKRLGKNPTEYSKIETKYDENIIKY